MENNEIKNEQVNERKPYYRKNNYRRHQWREKPQATSYIKSFDNFNDGFTEVIRFNPELKNYCGDFGSYDAVIASMTKAINDNIPSPNNINYPNTLSLSIDANEVGFKTDTNIALGWRIRYSYKEAKTYYNFRVTFISIPVYKNNTIADMVEAGWKKLVKSNRQNRYWNHLEGKDREESNEGFKVKELIGEQKINTSHPMSMPKAYHEDDYDDIEDSVADLREIHTVDNTPEEEELVEASTQIKFDDSSIDENESSDAEDILNPEDEVAIISDESVAAELGTDKIVLKGEDTSKEEATEKVKEGSTGFVDSKESISKTANPSVFIITHKGESRVINIDADDIAYGDMLINKETHLISFADGTIFDYKNLNILH